jgi:hypothetical protein
MQDDASPSVEVTMRHNVRDYHSKQEWEKMYKAAILESDPRRLATRVEKAEAAIVARSQQLSESSATHNKEQWAIVRAQYILSMLKNISSAPHA